MSNVVNKILNMLNMNVENQDDEEYEDEATIHQNKMRKMNQKGYLEEKHQKI